MSQTTRPVLVVVASVAFSALLLAACDEHPARVSLADLVREQEELSGKEVVTTGRIRRFEGDSRPYYVLEDRDQNRVALVPTRRAAPFESEKVVVSGTFEVKDGIGRVIEMRTLDTVD